MPRDRTRKSPAYPTGQYPELDFFLESLRTEVVRARYSVDGWYRDNVAAGLTDSLLTRLAGASADAWIAPREGSVVALWIFTNEARTAGTLTAKLFKNGVAFGSLQAVLDGTNTTFKASYVERKNAPFIAGDRLDVRVTTTAGWTPTTADIRAGIEVVV